jgi:ADP-ribose pyrophosphatase YjhB (NUDIX family)
VFEGYDFVKQEVFYRPLGGAIEFGETGEQAIRCEIEEELGAKIIEVRYLYTLENIFVCNGEPGHEIVLVYAAQFAEPSLYDQAKFAGQEDNGVPFVAMWKPLSDFAPGGAPLYPDGLLENLK